MREMSLWFAVYMVWLSAAATAWPIYAIAAYKGWRGTGGGPARFAVDVRRFVRWMLGGDIDHDFYEPGQKLRFGITLTLGSTSVIAAFYWQLSRDLWMWWQLAMNAFVVGISYAGIMVHLYVAWRETRNCWRALVWMQAALFVFAILSFDSLNIGLPL